MKCQYTAGRCWLFPLWVRRVCAGAVLAAITWASLMPSTKMPQEATMQLFVWLAHLFGCATDKLAHAMMYFVLYGAICWSLPPRSGRLPSPLIAFLFATAWGVLMELLQSLVTLLGFANRSFDIADMLANAIGALTAALTICSLKRLYLRWRASSHTPRAE